MSKKGKTEKNRIYQNNTSSLKTIIEIKEQRKASIVCLFIALTLFLIFIGFFAWHTARMRNYELNYVKTEGKIVDVEIHLGHSHAGDHSTNYYLLVISYTFDNRNYTFTDRTGYHSSAYNKIGTSTEIYVNPENPDQAETVTSSSYVSTICSCFFAFFCVAYATGMNILFSTQRSSFKKRFLFVWGIEILLGIAFLLLFWLGLPHSGFGDVFVRIEGAIGITVILGLVLFVSLLDGLITYKLHYRN